MKLKAVFFDMGGTIDTHTYDRRKGVQATAEIRTLLCRAGIRVRSNDEQLYDRVDRGLDAYRRWRERTWRELPPERVWREFVLKTIPIAQGQLNAVAENLAYTVDTCYYRRRMRPEIPRVLESLREMGLKLGIISNIQSRGQVPGDLERYGIRHFFDPIVLSSEYGRRKPDPAIFWHAAGLANVPAALCVHIGDRISRDVLGAKQAGFAMAFQIRHRLEETPDAEEPRPDALLDTMAGLPSLIGKLTSSGETGSRRTSRA
jgi:putative hydrolase of the HAD superfamily